MNELTDQKFWEKYWSKQTFNKFSSVFFDDLIPKLKLNKDSTVLEIGGFPGQFGAYLKKKYDCDISILDFYIDPKIIHRIEDLNGLERGAIKYFKGDISTTKVPEFDIVCSFGFIEHFQNTKEVIESHLKCLKKGGSIFITIPNFKGLNGKMQKSFDKKNYDKHNISCMDVSYLTSILTLLHVKDIEVKYYGKPTVWLEKDAQINSVFRYIINKFIVPALSLLPVKESRFFSPYIYLYGTK
jgi:SAM-dependent methyltransferase